MHKIRPDNGATASFQAYRPEHVWSAELGCRSSACQAPSELGFVGAYDVLESVGTMISRWQGSTVEPAIRGLGRAIASARALISAKKARRLERWPSPAARALCRWFA
jgi:hypothetical protein